VPYDIEEILSNPMDVLAKAVRDALTDPVSPGITADAIVMTPPIDRSGLGNATDEWHTVPRSALNPEIEKSSSEYPTSRPESYSFMAMVPTIHNALLKAPGVLAHSSNPDKVNDYLHHLTEFVSAAGLPQPAPGDLVRVRMRPAYGVGGVSLNMEEGDYVAMVRRQAFPEAVPNLPASWIEAGMALADLDWSKAPTDPTTGYRKDPGTFSWSDRKKQLKVKWDSQGFPEWNDQVIANGDAATAGPLLQHDEPSGATLVSPAMDDFLLLAAAYKARFNKDLKGSGYRTYDSQVNVRMIRAEGDLACRGHPQAGNGEGSGELDGNCKFVGKAATPGTSNHGWGAAIDIIRTDWALDQEGDSPEFRWLNKFSKNYNFVFGVKNEHWHLDWMKFSENVSTIRRTAQKSWVDPVDTYVDGSDITLAG